MKSKISIIDVRKTYKAFGNSGKSLNVLNNLNLNIAEQEFVCLLGASGCGKSTLLNIISGLDKEYHGKILINEQALSRDAEIRIGYIFQEPRLLPWLTAEKNVDFALTTCGIPKSNWLNVKDQYFELVGLEAFRNFYPHQMSGGMCQRLAIVRALCVEPDILLMDEPFSGLDELTARRLRVDLLRIWQEAKKTVVFVTHNSFESAYLADRVVIMSKGRIIDEIKVGVRRPRSYEDKDVFSVGGRIAQRLIRIVEEERPGDIDVPSVGMH